MIGYAYDDHVEFTVLIYVVVYKLCMYLKMVPLCVLLPVMTYNLAKHWFS